MIAEIVERPSTNVQLSAQLLFFNKDGCLYIGAGEVTSSIGKSGTARGGASSC